MSPYATCLTLAIFSGYLVWTSEAYERGWIRSPWRSPAFLMLVSGFAGARLLAVVAEWDRYGDQLFAANGPMAIQGAMGGFALSALVFARLRRLCVSSILDSVALALASMIPWIRIGCFLSGCCFGSACSLPWSVAGPDGSSVHPAQLYEAALGVFILVGAWRLRRSAPGSCLRFFLLSYGAGRALIECLRNDTPRWFGGWLTYPQLIALGMTTAGLCLALGASRRRRVVVPAARKRATTPMQPQKRGIATVESFPSD